MIVYIAPNQGPRNPCMSPESFLMARAEELDGIAEELSCSCYPLGGNDPDILAVRTAAEHIRDIVSITNNWPTMIMDQPTLEITEKEYGDDVVYSVTQQVSFLPVQAYRDVYGEESPTRPIVMSMVQRYKDHPDYNPKWG